MAQIPSSADAVIIGGGIVGCAVAYYCAKAGLDIALIERGELGGGTSSHCDGNILAIDKDPGFDSQTALTSQRLVLELAAELDDFEYRAPGSILVCVSDTEMEMARSWSDRQRALGLPFRMLDRHDLRDDSLYFAPDLLGGVECASDSTVNPALMVYALARGAERHGARLLPFTEATAILRQPDGSIAGVVTTGGKIATRKVVNACGVWAGVVAGLVGITLPIRPRKGHILVAARTYPVSRRKVMEFSYLMSKFGGRREVDEETERYGVAMVYEPTPFGNFLIGSSRQFVGYDAAIDTRVMAAVARRAVRFYPVLREIPVIRTYAGLRPATPDHLPIISEVPEVPGFFVAAGHEGDGIGLAPVTGKAVSEMLTAAPLCIDPGPVRFDRFGSAAS